MTNESDDLRNATQNLRITVAELTVTVKALADTVTGIQASLVTRDAHEGLKIEVQRVDQDAQAGIKRNDERWSRLAWFIGLAVGAALLALVINQGGVSL